MTKMVERIIGSHLMGNTKVVSQAAVDAEVLEQVTSV